MNPDLLAIVAPTMTVPMIYLLQLHKSLLLEGRGARVTRWLFLALAAAGLALAARQHFDAGSLALAAALASPAVHRLVFRTAFRRFVEKVGREPKDMVFNSDAGHFADRAFAMIVMLGCIFGSMAVSGYFLWNMSGSLR